MATARHARVVDAVTLAESTRHLRLQMEDGAPLGFAGGQYIIVDAGFLLPNGKACKRAYSILSADEQQQIFELAVLRLPDGPCSTYMHGLSPGARLTFSGPWGKMGPPVDGDAGGGASFLLATDTGLTSMLGLVRARRFAPLLGSTTLVWWRTAGDYFLPRAFVEARLPSGLGDVRIETLPAVGDPQRIPLARELLRQVWSRAPLRRGYVAGDGAINYALLDDLVAGGVPATREHVESFFNMPKKSEAAAPVQIVAAP